MGWSREEQEEAARQRLRKGNERWHKEQSQAAWEEGQRVKKQYAQQKGGGTRGGGCVLFVLMVGAATVLALLI